MNDKKRGIDILCIIFLVENLGGFAQCGDLLFSKSNRLRNITVVKNADGRLEVFGTGNDDSIWHTWQTAPNNGWNGSWGELYGPSNKLRNLLVIKNLDGQIEVFGIAPDNTIWHTWQTNQTTDGTIMATIIQ